MQQEKQKEKEEIPINPVVGQDGESDEEDESKKEPELVDKQR